MTETERPSLLVLRTHVGLPSPDFTDDHAAHGNPFKAADVTRTKEVMGIPDEPFWAPDELVAATRANAAERGADARVGVAAAVGRDHRVARVGRPRGPAPGSTAGTRTSPHYDMGESLATRKAIQKALDRTYDNLPGLVSGSADLSGSNGTVLDRDHAAVEVAIPAAATSTSASANTPWAPRWSAWPSTAACCPSAARSSCSPTT